MASTLFLLFIKAIELQLTQSISTFDNRHVVVPFVRFDLKGVCYTRSHPMSSPTQATDTLPRRPVVVMKTRRKAKASTVVPHSDDAETHDEHELSLTLPDDFDLEALSEILPDTNFTSPSHDTIINIYQILLAQAVEGRSIAHELDEARAELEKKDVELDQALQDKESVLRESETSLENVQKDLAQVKEERDQLGMSFVSNSLCFQ